MSSRAHLPINQPTHFSTLRFFELILITTINLSLLPNTHGIQILFSLLFQILVYYGRPLTRSFTAILYGPLIPQNPFPHFLNCLLHTSQTKFPISTSTFSPPFPPLSFIFLSIYPSRFPHLCICLSKWNIHLILQCSNYGGGYRTLIYLTSKEHLTYNCPNYSLHCQSFTFYWIFTYSAKILFRCPSTLEAVSRQEHYPIIDPFLIFQ